MKKQITQISIFGFNLTTDLFIIFLILKLVNIITWSWWWVTSPLWIPILIGVIALCILIIIGGLIGERNDDNLNL